MNPIASPPEAAIRDIPLCRLALAPENVRKTPPDEAAQVQLQASIAAHGLLKNLVARPDAPDADGVERFAVVAGGRRLAALQALAESLNPSRVSRSTGQQSVLRLELGVAARAGEPVTLTYSGTELRAAPSAGGRRAPMFRDFPVTNNTPGGAGPSPLQASVSARSLRLVFDGALDGSSLPAGNAFLVHTSDLDEDGLEIAGTGTAAVSGNEVTVQLAGAVRADELARVSYARPDTNWLRGAGSGTPAVLSFDRFRIETVDEGDPPRVVAGAVSGIGGGQSKAVLSFSEALDGSSVPAAGDFAVTIGAGNTAVTVSAAAVEGRNVVLTLGSAMASGTTVAVSYTPGTNPIRDAAGNAAAGFMQELTAGSAGRPAVQSASVDGARVVLTYDRPLDPGQVPGPERFTLHNMLGLGETVTDRTEYFIGIAAVGVEGQSVVLHLEHPVFPCVGYGRTDHIAFTVSYARPAGSPLRGLRGRATDEADGFSHEDVANARTAKQCRNGINRARTGSVILGAGRPFTKDAAPRTAWFAVTASGGPVTVMGAAFSADDPRELKLTVDRDLAPGETVTASYRRPEGARGLWDVDGRQLADVVDLPVANAVARPANTPATGAPKIVGTARVSYADPATGLSVEARARMLVFPCTGAFTVSYGKPAASPLRGLRCTTADEADGFSHQGAASVRANNRCSSGWVSARIGSVILTAARPLATDSPPQAAWFTVTASGGPVTVTGAAFSPDDPRELKLTLDRDIAPGETVAVSYTRPCQSALKIDPLSACNTDPPWRHGGGCPGSQ